MHDLKKLKCSNDSSELIELKETIVVKFARVFKLILLNYCLNNVKYYCYSVFACLQVSIVPVGLVFLMLA